MYSTSCKINHPESLFWEDYVLAVFLATQEYIMKECETGEASPHLSHYISLKALTQPRLSASLKPRITGLTCNKAEI